MKMEYIERIAKEEREYIWFLGRIGNGTTSPTGRFLIKLNRRLVKEAEEEVQKHGYKSLGEFHTKFWYEKKHGKEAGK